jgi:hypothetical protein
MAGFGFKEWTFAESSASPARGMDNVPFHTAGITNYCSDPLSSAMLLDWCSAAFVKRGRFGPASN